MAPTAVDSLIVTEDETWEDAEEEITINLDLNLEEFAKQELCEDDMVISLYQT